MNRFPHDPGPHWGEVGIHGLHRLREWDAIALVEVPATDRETVEFVALPDGSFVVESGRERSEVAAFAGSLDLAAPYRAEAVHRREDTWAVGGRSIEVVELAGRRSGTEIEIVWDGTERATRIDGEPTFASAGELEALAAARYDTWVVRAHRLRGTFWELEISSL